MTTYRHLDREITALAYTSRTLNGQIIYERDPDNDVGVWAGRRDITAADSFRAAGNTLLLLVTDAIYTVRADDGYLFPIAANFRGMADEDGVERFIVGRQPIGRNRYTELLCRLVVV